MLHIQIRIKGYCRRGQQYPRRGKFGTIVPNTYSRNNAGPVCVMQERGSMKELVEVIAKALVDHPDEVVVTEKTEGRNIVVELHVAASDMGKVIGKQGRIAKAIRSVVKAASSKENKIVDVEIV